MESKTKGLVWIIVAAGFIAACVYASPLIIRQIPWSAEKRLARWVDLSAGEHVCRSPLGTSALGKLVARLHPNFPQDHEFPLSVQVIERPEINAFASFGGEIFILNGLLGQAESPEELAGVLAHEMEHVAQRHILQGTIGKIVTSVILQSIFSGGPADPRLWTALAHQQYGRAQEEQADRGGLERLRAAQVDASGLIHFFERMENQRGTSNTVEVLLSDHPSNQSRAELARTYQLPSAKRVLSANEWKNLREICQKI